jgi:hypothetical protein
MYVRAQEVAAAATVAARRTESARRVFIVGGCEGGSWWRKSEECSTRCRCFSPAREVRFIYLRVRGSEAD